MLVHQPCVLPLPPHQVSVLVAAGDDGSGQTATCPVDPRLPVDVSGGAVDGAANSCPFESRDDCNCASFEMELQRRVF